MKVNIPKEQLPLSLHVWTNGMHPDQVAERFRNGDT
jgi:hypothetical protein